MPELIDSSYDPEYEEWEFGKLSALREIAFAQENGYPYYYMGLCLFDKVSRTLINF